MSSSSKFSKQLASDAGIVDLMADLGHALNVNPDMLFLGGGNPAHIPEFEEYAAKHLRALIDDKDAFHRLLGIYQSPQGSEVLISNLARFFQAQGWPVTERNICLTNGSQSAFFMLINLLAGQSDGGPNRKMCLPLVPEYLGYADQGLSDDMFCSVKPKIELIGQHRFKYHIDFDALEITDNIGALCVSRPTNPSANMLADEELDRLGCLADQHEIPLIVDCAYGQPFPGIVYGDQSTRWQANRIFVLSLSKLGMPGVRTGIVVADQPIIESLTKANTVVSLANGNFGPGLMNAFLESGDLAPICTDILLPFYQQKRALALKQIDEQFNGLDYRVHQSDGAFFLWLWFPSLEVESADLYQRLKAKNVLVMSGEHFFFEHAPSWEHAKQCIRISYCASDDVLTKAIAIIAEEVRRVQSPL